MKKTLIFLAILLVSVFSGLSRVAGHARNPLPSGSPMQQQIVSKEREELDSLKTGNMELFASLLADEAVFVDAHGSASKAEVVKNTSDFRLQEYSMEDVRFVPVSETSGLIAYKLTEKGISHGKEFAAQVYVSALWTARGGKWICLFSQETSAR
jgi:hypothetical protein